ncbi:MAG: cytochrome D ubiquinol oxidase subunit II, partial [Woeseiaceae bacterium]
MTHDNKDTDGIPSPPHPLQREEPLPSQTVKSGIDDPVALQRVEQLLESATYRRADLDVDFLDQDDVRGARLQLDYLKPELHLRERGIEHTIVVFGGTRIPEPKAAKRKLQARRRALEEDPENSDLAKRVEIAERVLTKSAYYEVARDLGEMVGLAGKGPGDCRVTLMTGGGPGIMEAANRGAFEAGA